MSLSLKMETIQVYNAHIVNIVSGAHVRKHCHHWHMVTTHGVSLYLTFT